MSSCKKDIENNDESKFIFFSKILLKSFLLIVSILILVYTKNKYISKDSTVLNFSIFSIITTILLSILGLVDNYIYTNISVGLGLGLGMQLMQIN